MKYPKKPRAKKIREPGAPVGAAEFKATCLEWLDEMAAGHPGIVITKRGKPVARLVPMTSAPVTSFGILKGLIDPIPDEILLAPTVPDDEWDDEDELYERRQPSVP